MELNLDQDTKVAFWFIAILIFVALLVTAYVNYYHPYPQEYYRCLDRLMWNSSPTICNVYKGVP